MVSNESTNAPKDAEHRMWKNHYSQASMLEWFLSEQWDDQPWSEMLKSAKNKYFANSEAAGHNNSPWWQMFNTHVVHTPQGQIVGTLRMSVLLSAKIEASQQYPLSTTIMAYGTVAEGYCEV